MTASRTRKRIVVCAIGIAVAASIVVILIFCLPVVVTPATPSLHVNGCENT